MLRETMERRRAAWEQDLVARMRRDDPEAYREFFRCFRPLLIAEARRLRIQPALWQELADECLDDVAMRLRRYTTPIPRSLAPYLVRALRIHRLALRRDERRRVDGEGDGERSGTDPSAPLASALSEDTLRASAGPDGEPTPASTALERLASMVEEGLSREEEVLLSWVSRYVPQSDVAQWLGISHGAARNRVMRLRARLKEVALQHVATFTGRERDELREFFRRTVAATRDRTSDRTERGATQPDAPPPPRRAGNDREEP